MSEPGARQSTALLILSLVSAGLTYVTAIVLARALGADAYGDYVVAISSVLLLATLAELGTGKFAMRIVPVYVRNEQWSLAKGYNRFSLVVILTVSLILAVVAITGETAEDGRFGDYALGFAFLFLPIVACVGAGAEFVVANLAPVRSALIARLLVPGVTLLVAAAWISSALELSAPRATLCFGAGWTAGLIAILFVLRRTTPREVMDAGAEYQSRDWLSNSIPFLVVALLVTAISRIGVIILEVVHPDESMVAVYSAAFDTGTFIYIVAKSTDKQFLPRISLMIEARDSTSLLRVRSRRWVWMGILCGAFLLVVFPFGRLILSLFGPEFVKGFPALCILAVTTVIWAMFSLGPTYLIFIQRKKTVIAGTGIALAVHIGLCFPLGARFGATGAALSYAVAVIGLYVTLFFVANHQLRQSDLQTTGSPGEDDRDASPE